MAKNRELSIRGIEQSIQDFARLLDLCLNIRERDFACKKSEAETQKAPKKVLVRIMIFRV